MQRNFLREVSLILVGGILLYAAQYLFDVSTSKEADISWSVLTSAEIHAGALREEFEFSNQFLAVIIRNEGSAVANDVEIIWETRPNFYSIPRQIDWTWAEENNGNQVLKLNALQPKQGYLLTFIGDFYVPRLGVLHQNVSIEEKDRLLPVSFGETVISRLMLSYLIAAFCLSVIVNFFFIFGQSSKKQKTEDQ